MHLGQCACSLIDTVTVLQGLKLIRAKSRELFQIKVGLVMDLPTVGWHFWDRIKLRMLPVSQYNSFERISKEVFPERGIVFRYFSGITEFFLHRLALLSWIGELELARKLWEEEKERRYLWGMDFEDFLFRVIICEIRIGSGHKHPESGSLVEYHVLDEEDAFKLSTIPLSELLKMDKPHFSSVDGLVTVDFDEHELRRIAKIVQEKYQKELRLPLILLRKVKGYVEPYKAVGTKLENMLLQRLLKLTEAPFETYSEVEEKRELTSISMLRRRRFKTIYKVLPETTTIWLSTTHQHPSLR